MKDNENIEILDDIVDMEEQHINGAEPSLKEDNDISVMPISPPPNYTDSNIEQFDFENLFGAEVITEEPPIQPLGDTVDFAPKDPKTVNAILEEETDPHGVKDSIKAPTRRKRNRVNLPKLDVKKVTQSVKNLDEESKNAILFIGALTLLIAIVIFILPLLIDIFGY